MNDNIPKNIEIKEVKCLGHFQKKRKEYFIILSLIRSGPFFLKLKINLDTFRVHRQLYKS